MNLLCDTRNFHYTIAQIDGLSIHLDGSNTKITIPESQYEFIVKSLLTSNEYVLSLASLQVDEAYTSHLVASENENLQSYSSKTLYFQSENRYDPSLYFYDDPLELEKKGLSLNTIIYLAIFRYKGHLF